jgi:crossover junction endodeoxyribonuclease RuvC
MRVLGIDPSLRATGYGIIDFKDNEYSVITYGVIKPSKSVPLLHRINEIKNRIEDLIRTHQPEEIAIEDLFYAQNIKTAITLGQVRGAALIAVAASNCQLFEYSALEIKKAVTGYGQADKDQVRHMIRVLLELEDDKIETDASDALATAICHVNTKSFLEKIPYVND